MLPGIDLGGRRSRPVCRLNMRIRTACVASVTTLIVLTGSVPIHSQQPVRRLSVFDDQGPVDRVGPPEALQPTSTLTASDVLALVRGAAEALDDQRLAVAVVDRTGAPLGVYLRPGATAATADVALALARTGAFFSNNQAPLSSRTVRFISGIHFPPGIANTSAAALYGIEDSNRGCAIDDTGDTLFNPGARFPRPRSLAGTLGDPPLGCSPLESGGCQHGSPILGEDGQPLVSVGISTGKANLRDRDPGGDVEEGIDPGGIPVFKSGEVAGGIGVAGVSHDRAEYAATLASATAGNGIGFPDDLPDPGAVYVDGIRLPFFRDCTSIDCIRDALATRPAGSAAGRFADGAFILGPIAGSAAPEGYLIGPRASAASDGLSASEVDRIVQQAVAAADRTRAVIRLPYGQTTRMVISVADAQGEILAAYRMPDSTIFSLDVAMTKARNAYYFSSREGYEVLRGYVQSNPYDRYRWEPEPPAGKGWAITNRTLSFGGQPLFPPGIDLEKTATPGPWFDLFVYDSVNPCTEGPGPSRGANRSYINQSGIVWFPGSAPLYKNGQLVGGLGVSGDGVEQDDYVTALASEGFTAPDELRVDRSFIVTGRGDLVRLPYWKFPRNPEER
jgi:uncharacterized protein GlcG (DUF336 family)